MATKKRLIDAGDLWSDIMMLPHNGDIVSSEEVEQAIKDAPTVDAVEVVRCKDCKHYARDKMFGGGYCYGAKKKLDDFCSCGERINNET